MREILDAALGAMALFALLFGGFWMAQGTGQIAGTSELIEVSR